jgi:hypothetical protein
MSFRPRRHVIGDLRPTRLTEGEVSSVRVFLVFGERRRLSIKLVVRFSDGRGRDMVQTARDKQQWRTVVNIEVNGSSGVGTEVGKGGLK